MRDLLNNSTQKELLPAKQRTAVATGDSIDLKGKGRKVLTILSCGDCSADASVVVTIQESSDGTSFATLQVFGAVSTSKILVLDLTPTKQYIRAVSTVANANTIDYAVIGLIYNEREIPSEI